VVLRPALCLAAGLGLAACTETGDFGRPKPGLFTETIAPYTGTVAAALRSEPVSVAMLTDDEQELRNRAYHYLMPAKERSYFDRVLADLSARRVLSPDLTEQAESEYYQTLTSRTDRSPRPRYQALREDLEADRLLMGPFVAVACRVKEADRIRLKAAERLPPDDVSRSLAEGRVGENEMLTGWVFGEMKTRVTGYRYALEHLVVDSPDRDAVKVERTLIAVESDRAGLERCVGRRSVSVQFGKGDAGPRYLPHADKPELPPK
jgi:hypothetical protein